MSIWYMLQDHEKYAYHYTRPESLIKILESGRIRFSSFSKLNDPRESKDWVLNFSSQGADLALAGRVMTDSLNRHLKHSWRVGCFVSDPYEACSTPARERKGEDIIGAAYDRGHSRPRMWAQYAEDYHGACLVFDRARLDAAIRDAATREGQQVLHDKVTYRNPNVVANLSRPDALTMSLDRILQIGPEAAVKEHVALHWRELFMLKSKDWEQERELRWLVSADSDRDFFVSMDDACVGIALGDRAPLVAGNATSAYAETRDTSLAIMTWKNGFPQPSPTHWRPLKTPLPPRPPLHQRLRTRTKTIIDCLKDGSLKT